MTKKSFIFYILSLCTCIVIFLSCPQINKTSTSSSNDSKLAPPDGMIYHGVQAEVRPVGIFSRHVDWDGIEDYTEACGHRPKLVLHYITLDPFAFWLLKSTVLEMSQQSYDYIPQIGLDFYSYPMGHSIINPHDITERIAKGDYDKAIEELADLFIEMDIPVFLRPGYEFGGNGHGRHASKKYWIKAWKRIYDVFKNREVEKVRFVWNTLDEKNYIGYYPGDEYVDWWAINIFMNHSDNNAFVNRFIQDAAKHHKPVMIAESTPRNIGSTTGRKSWEKWYSPYFNLLSKYPHIKAFCYINASWKDFPGRSFTEDCRIQSNDYVTSQYKKIMSDQRFIGASRKDAKNFQ